MRKLTGNLLEGLGQPERARAGTSLKGKVTAGDGWLTTDDGVTTLWPFRGYTGPTTTS